MLNRQHCDWILLLPVQSPRSGSPSPPGAESCRRLLQDDSFESPSGKEVGLPRMCYFWPAFDHQVQQSNCSLFPQSRKSLASFPTYVEGKHLITSIVWQSIDWPLLIRGMFSLWERHFRCSAVVLFVNIQGPFIQRGPLVTIMQFMILMLKRPLFQFHLCSSRPLWPRGFDWWDHLCSQLPGLHPAAVRQDSIQEHPHDAGAGGSQSHQGEHTVKESVSSVALTYNDIGVTWI